MNHRFGLLPPAFLVTKQNNLKGDCKWCSSQYYYQFIHKFISYCNDCKNLHLNAFVTILQFIVKLADIQWI